jgi:sulfur-oxidizing protein SoxA
MATFRLPSPHFLGRTAFTLLLAAAGVLLAVAIGVTQEQETAPYEVDGRMSGYLFLGQSTRDLQDDEFLNPGMFAVERGRQLWSTVDGTEGLSCASCHEDVVETMRGVAARYPQYDEELGRLMNLELRINAMRTDFMGAEAYPYESADLIALTTFIAYQSRGMPMEVAVDGPAEPYFEAGEEFYMTRRGQLDLACTQCHDQLVGSHLRGDLISQGQINGFPLYRNTWNAMGSRHRMFAWCNTSIRAEPHAYGSEEYLALELYLAWRGRGLPIESPAVRR